MVDFFNFTYSTNPCHTNVPVPAFMRRGSFSYFDTSMGQGLDLREIGAGRLDAARNPSNRHYPRLTIRGGNGAPTVVYVTTHPRKP